jgi:itaconyl-CoA hydratase
MPDGASDGKEATMAEQGLGETALWPKGNLFEDFRVGQTFDHHWGRTLTEADNTLFSTLTLHFNPLYFNRPFAESHGHPTTPINPLLVFNTVLGLSVEDLSEAGGPFLGLDNLSYLAPVYPGDTLIARSTTVSVRDSSGHTGAGIVGWRTEGFNQRGEKVIEFERANLVRRRQNRGQSGGPT